MRDKTTKVVTVRVSHEVTVTRYVDVVVIAQAPEHTYSSTSAEARAKDFVVAATNIGEPLDWHIEEKANPSFGRYGLTAEVLGKPPEFAEIVEPPWFQPAPLAPEDVL